MKTEFVLSRAEISFGETRKLPPTATLAQIQEYEKYLANIDVSEAFDVIFDIDTEEVQEDPNETAAGKSVAA